jgi:alpha-D-xyloside xylohydrolase
MRLAVLLFVVACGDNTPITAVPVTSGPASLILSSDLSTLTFVRGTDTLLTFHADAFQAGTVDDLESGDSFDPYWLFKDSPVAPDSLEWRALAPTAPMKVTASTPDKLVLELAYDGATGTVTLTRAAPGCFTLKLDATATGQSVAYLRVRPDADATENFYGLGEWGDSVSHRGKLRPMQMEADFGSESADDEAHVPVPLLVGTRGWGVFVPSDRAGTFDVARATPTLIDITFGTGDASPDGLTVELFSDTAPLDVLKHYFDLTGYPGIPAPWAYGPLLWRDGNQDQAQVLDDITQIRTRHLATSGIWFDRPYATGVETFDFDPARFPDPPAMLQALHDAGLRYGVWQSPYTAAATNGEDPAPAQHDYAQANGFFPPMTAVLVNQWGKPIDFTNPAAYAWWSQNLASYTRPLGGGGLGVEGFKLDYGEDIVVGLNGQRASWLFADGSDERTMHRGYTLLYHQIHRELLAPEGAFLLTRTGRWGDQTKGMIIWPGDLDADFSHEGDPQGGLRAVGGLPAALIKGIGLSASGFPFYASDTAGYRHSPASNECWLRWAEANTIGSAMEVGDSSSAQPWEFNAQNGRTQHTLDVYQKYASLHLRLYPYAWTYARQIATTGRPIVRPFGLAHPEVGQHPDDEFLFGDHVLVAPVVAAGQTSRDVWLPPGTWFDWWTGFSLEGGAGGAKITASADLDTLPLYLASGSIVPMLRDSIETLAPVAPASSVDSFATTAGVLVVRVAPGPKSSFTVYDGTKITREFGSVQYVPGSVFAQGALFELIATPLPASVHAGGVALVHQPSLAALEAAGTGWFWESTTAGTLWIEVAGAATVAIP